MSTDPNVWKFYLYMSVIIVKDANLRSDGRKEVVELAIVEPNDVLNNEGLIKKIFSNYILNKNETSVHLGYKIIFCIDCESSFTSFTTGSGQSMQHDYVNASQEHKYVNVDQEGKHLDKTMRETSVDDNQAHSRSAEGNETVAQETNCE